MATSAQPAVLLYRGLMKGDGETEFHSRFVLPCDGTETLLRVCQTECPISIAAERSEAAISLGKILLVVVKKECNMWNLKRRICLS